MKPAAHACVLIALSALALPPASAQDESALGRTGVTVEQPTPQTDGGPPASGVRVEQPRPRVEGPPPGSRVRVSPPEPRMEEGRTSPTVRIEQPRSETEGGPRTGSVAVEQPAPRVAPTPPPGAVRVDPGAAASRAPVDEGGAAARDGRDGDVIPLAALEGREVVNASGEAIGTLETVLLDPDTGEPVVVVSAGGFLGLWGTEVAFPYGDLAAKGDALVLDTRLTADEIAAMQPYDTTAYRPLPDRMRAD